MSGDKPKARRGPKVKPGRDEAVLKVRARGWSYSVIADIFGMSAANVVRICRKAKRELKTEEREGEE